VPVAFDPTVIDDQVIAAAYHYWRTRAGERRMPDRVDLDPLSMPRQILPHILLWDVLGPGRGYRCRLAGEAISAAHGRSVKGMTTAELHGPTNESIEREYDLVVRTCEPHYVRRSMFWFHRDYRYYRRLLLPLSNGGADCRLLLSIATYDYGDR